MCCMVYFYGCAATEQKIYLGNTDVYAPVTPPPVHIIKNDTVNFTVSPYFTIMQNKNIKGKTKDAYSPDKLSDISTVFPIREQNLVWTFPSVAMGIDVDFPFAKAFGLFGGLRYSNTSNEDLWGGNFGISLIGRNESYSFRLDAGFLYQQYYYNAATILYINSSHNSKGPQAFYSTDVDKTYNINPLLTLTYNSKFKNSPWNIFISAGYFSQNLLGFEPGQHFNMYSDTYVDDKRNNYNVGFLILNPGVTYSLNPQMDICFNLKLLNESQTDINNSNTFLLPSVQLNWSF